MRKLKSLFVLAVAVIGFSAFVVSCGKDDEKSTCMCTETDYEGYSASREVSPASFGAANCSDLELKLKEVSNFEFGYTCR